MYRAPRGKATVHIRANADTGAAIRRAFEYGAEGIGLCRTGYSFFRPDLRRLLHRFVVKGEGGAGRAMFEAQEAEFGEILAEVPAGRPIAVRLWDNPLGDFLRPLRECNPALGTRGVRVGTAYPALYQLQIGALLSAFRRVPRSERPDLEILIPFVSFAGEYARWRNYIKRRARDAKVGCMIETPGAVLRAEEFARRADLLCVGTNDLTQTVLGISRDDYEAYRARCGDDCRANPFELLDESVMRLVGELIARARRANPFVMIGIVGAQASVPRNLRFLAGAGFDYMSVNFTDIGALAGRMRRMANRARCDRGGGLSCMHG